MNFLRQLLRKLSSNRQTESTEIINRATLRVVSNYNSNIHILFHHKIITSEKCIQYTTVEC